MVSIYTTLSQLFTVKSPRSQWYTGTMETNPKAFYANKFNVLDEVGEDLDDVKVKLLALRWTETRMPGGDVEEINVLIDTLQDLQAQVAGLLAAVRPLV